MGKNSCFISKKLILLITKTQPSMAAHTDFSSFHSKKSYSSSTHMCAMAGFLEKPFKSQKYFYRYDQNNLRLLH
jgi:hypothetical protein